MWVHVARLLDRELEIRNAERVDELRKYRVAIRRLRSALRVFGLALPKGPAGRLRRGLGDLGDAVGAIRDADVRIANATAYGTAALGGLELLGPLITTWRADRERAYARLIRRIDSGRHRRWLGRLGTFVQEPPEVPEGSARGPGATVRGSAAAHIWLAYERVRGYSAIVPSAGLVELHQLRTETKRLRYSLEFLADIRGPERASLIAAVTGLQDHLGAINDAAVTIVAIKVFVERQGESIATAERAAIDGYLAEREGELDRLRQTIGRAWSPVASETFARRLGRTVVIV